ncbi:MAG: calcium/sodium antiporter, partial [Gammaproteobacteria bacterium]|nr:calcium/sodium antiporter [Gammaproteobacteria bacterium]
MLTVILNLAGGLVMLMIGGEGLVKGAVSTGLRFGLTPLAAGLTIVAFGTSAPELMVNLRAATLGQDGLAVGNVVGSNIANIGLILGVSVLVSPLKLDVRAVRNEVYIMAFSMLLLVLFLLDGRLERFEAMILVAGIIINIFINMRAARRARSVSHQKYRESVHGADLPAWKGLTLITVGLAMLVGGGFFFVKGAVQLAAALGASPALIGLTVVAIGTSLPELATSSIAAVRGYGDMAIGNVVGSNTFNVLAVLGLTALIMPLDRSAVSNIDLMVMLAFSLYMVRLMRLG